MVARRSDVSAAPEHNDISLTELFQAGVECGEERSPSQAMLALPRCVLYASRE